MKETHSSIFRYVVKFGYRKTSVQTIVTLHVSATLIHTAAYFK